MPQLDKMLAMAGMLAVPGARAIAVAPNSPCSSQCGNDLSQTSAADLVCQQGNYGDSTGVVFEACINCELTSGYSTGNNDSDTKWVLYNMRYTLNHCLWQVLLGPCVTSKACGHFRNAVGYMNLSTSTYGYEYCSEWPVTDYLRLDACTSCLQVSEQQYLSNFMTVLQAGCEQKPVSGVNLGLEGNIFSTTTVNITAPTPSSQVNPAWFNQGPLGLGGRMGIAVGGLVLVLVLLGCGIVWRGKRRRRAFLRRLQADQTGKGWPTPKGQGEMFETPVSQQPLRGWDDSPQSAYSQTGYPRYCSPYASQHDTPVSANDVLNMQWSRHGIGMALGGEEESQHYAVGAADGGGRYFDNFSPEEKGKGKALEESYEMNEVDVDGSGSGDARAENHPEAHEEPTEPPMI